MPDHGPIGFQVDITGAISALGSLLPVLKALSTDGVDPLAVYQLEAIGSKFPMSGPLADKTLGALTRSGSFKLRNLQVSVGWMGGDSTWALSQTAGGQASSLLTVCLVEMCCRNMAGHILFDLSKKILPKSHHLSSIEHLSDLCEIVSHKMKAVQFGQHQAEQVTRIREVYRDTGIDIHRDSASLVDRISVDSMVDILDKARAALLDPDGTTTLRIEGFGGIGTLAALFTGLCRDDVLLLVENEVIFRGPRRSIIISVVHGKRLQISQERVIQSSDQNDPVVSPVGLRKDDFLGQPGRISGFDRLTVGKEACLRSMVELLFSHRVIRSERQVVVSLGNLVGAIFHSFKASDCGHGSDLPDGGLRALLGNLADHHLRDQLSLLFGVELEINNFDVGLAYQNLRTAVVEILPDSECTCGGCPNSYHWDDLSSKRDDCYVRSIWAGLQPIIGYAILLSFVDIRCSSIRLLQYPNIKAGRFFCNRVIAKVQQSAPGSKHLAADAEEYSVTDLHTDLCEMLDSKSANAGAGQTVIGTCNGSTAIFPATLLKVAFDESTMVRYILLDGQYHDGVNYYKALIEDANIPPRPEAERSLQQNGKICLSALGVHDKLVLTARPYHSAFGLRTSVEVGGRMINLSFYALQMAYMSTTIAPPCHHVRNTSPPPPYDANSIVATGVEAPLASRGRLSVASVHKNSVAQYLVGIQGARSLFQGNSCLDCVMKKAQLDGYQLLIQS
ncbi:hypothetical protein TWF730_001947 [Orbilia blumenaviensis]|uniref:Uncharacterized protein n=1 Tax=Orbilia blumenaviensis TaxID=1796055 RepID=A0AAV9UD74_9PEZI